MRKIWQRITHLMTADLHGVLDNLESTVLSMRQDLREMESELERERGEIARLAGTRDRLARAAEHLASEVTRIEADLELALGAGKDDLARFCIKQLRPLVTEANNIARERDDVDTKLATLQERVATRTSELGSLTARVEAAAACEAARHERECERPTTRTYAMANEEVDLELMRRKQEHGSRAEAGS